MTATVDQAFITQFSDNIYMLMEQSGSKARKSVVVEQAKGERHAFERLGNFTVQEVTDRREKTVLQDAPHSRRWALVKQYHAGTYLADIDRLKMLIQPQSEYSVKLANAHGKHFDEVVWAAALGTAITGKNGDGTQAFDTANQQVAHGSAGMTIAKFNEALGILEGNELDMESAELYLAIGSDGVNKGLMEDTEYTSFDYQSMKTLTQKGLPDFRGVNLIRSQRIPDETAGTTQRCLLYTDSALRVALARDLTLKVAERADEHFNLQMSTYMNVGAVRMEEEAIVDILYQ